MTASYFYPRPPRGGRPIEGDKTYENIKFLSPPSARRATRQIPLYLPWQGISIPALREEGDERGKNLDPIDLLFLSPPSARRATRALHGAGGTPQISIPALREEGDMSSTTHSSRCSNFYPRPPRGGRLSLVNHKHTDSRFLSPPSARKATCRCWSSAFGGSDFYPRPPRGGRPAATWHRRPPSNFYPRPPRGGRLAMLGHME